MQEIWSNPLFGILLTVTGFAIGEKVARKFKSPLANPILVAMLFCFLFLQIFRVPLKSYMIGGNYIVTFVTPATAVLGLSVFRQRKVLKEQFIPILTGCLMGSLGSIGSMVLLCRLFGMKKDIIISLIPKSVTTAVGLDISASLGGIRSITMLAILICGIAGAIIHPIVIKVLHLTDRVAIGVAFGTSSHAIGTSKALTYGEVEGAVSSVSIGVAAICTVIIALFI